MASLDKIRQVRRNYIAFRILYMLFLSFAIASIMTTVLSVLFFVSAWWMLLFFLLTTIALFFIRKPWATDDLAIAAFLDAHYPVLEESSGLVLKPQADLNLLEQLQLAKLAPVLQQLPSGHPQFLRPLKWGGALFLAGIGLLLCGRSWHIQYYGEKFQLNSVHGAFAPSVAEKLLPQMESVTIHIVPPAYTHLDERAQNKLTIQAEEGSAVHWILKTNSSAKSVALLFNELENIPMKAAEGRRSWSALKEVNKDGFYQVIIDGKRSDLYQLQVIRDLPPVILIKTPKQYTYIDAGEKPQVNVTTIIIDDYGISDATLFATVAKGSGEGVKFKEQKIGFGTSFTGQKKLDLRKMIDLPTLNMEPGDELYFYIEAKDNHQQLSRTDVYIVAIQDTAQLLSMDGILSTGNLKPEYFRSERQIIMDSEALLKEKDTLSKEKFNARSNELGTDQKLLRLRYGKFLGEEAEDTPGDQSPGGNNPLSDPKDFSNAAKILDAYTDKHDNAEDAQFFDPTVKAQLKATLTEMWKAELQLRLYKPQEALPFEYKALRLLKDLQQKSRSFVAKTDFNPTPLKMEKRLSGDLSKVTEPVNHADNHAVDDRLEALKKSIELLDHLKPAKRLSGPEFGLLQSANLQISERAALQPGRYLGAANAMRRILAGSSKTIVTDVAIVEAAIQKILPQTQPLPQSKHTSPDMGLSGDYYLKLNHYNR